MKGGGGRGSAALPVAPSCGTRVLRRREGGEEGPAGEEAGGMRRERVTKKKTTPYIRMPVSKACNVPHRGNRNRWKTT